MRTNVIYYEDEGSYLVAKVIDYEIIEKKWFANITVQNKRIKTAVTNLKSEEYVRYKQLKNESQ